MFGPLMQRERSTPNNSNPQENLKKAQVICSWEQIRKKRDVWCFSLHVVHILINKFYYRNQYRSQVKIK